MKQFLAYTHVVRLVQHQSETFVVPGAGRGQVQSSSANAARRGQARANRKNLLPKPDGKLPRQGYR